jgi:predicted alpha/beta superfamily hydrolase
MRKVILTIAAAVVALAGCAEARAQTERPSGPVQHLGLKSTVLGEDRTILVRTPAGYEHNGERYPVLYMTDGAAHFVHTCATVEFLARNDRMPEMIVVAIENTDRTRDLTPTRIGGGPDGPQPHFATSGGADRFLDFVEKELIPVVEERYRTHPYRVFAGHSFGGLLGVHAFATRPDLFNACISVSPSLWWDNALPVRKTEELFASRGELNRSIYVTLGDEPGDMLDAFNRFRRLLEKKSPSGLEWGAARLADEDHGSVVMRSHYDGLRHVFKDWRPPVDPQTGALAGGIDGYEAHTKKLSKKYGFPVGIPERILNAFGYQLLAAGKTGDAIRVFERNVRHHPASANVYDSLGEAYERDGRLDLARENYEKAVTIGASAGDPNLGVFKANLQRVATRLGSKGT